MDSETISAILVIHIYSDGAVSWAYENACRHCQLSVSPVCRELFNRDAISLLLRYALLSLAIFYVVTLISHNVISSSKKY